MCLICADKKQFGNKKYNHKFLNKAFALLLLMAISQNNEIMSNLLQCPRDNNDKIFYTLMDYLNNLFISNDPKDILRFYDYFENRDQLIKWMNERPKGNYRIVEFNNEENDIIVVIPTMDVNGKLAKTCRDDIFKGLHIIFVESGRGNYYFNYAHNCNAGIKKALEYNPKWIVLSNDDMYKIDEVEILKNELSKIDHKDYNVVFAKQSDYHTIPCYIYKYNIYNYFFDVLILLYLKYFYQLKVQQFKLINNYNVKYWVRYNNKSKKILKLINNLLDTKIKNTDFIQMVDFVIFSSNLFKKFENFYFDETFINAAEDSDLSFKIKINKIKYKIINYQISDFVGLSLGKYELRAMRSAIGDVYFSYKFETFYLDKLNK